MPSVFEESNGGIASYQSNSSINEYELRARLGGNEISATFLSRHKGTQEFVVIKAFPKSLPLAVTLYETEVKAFEKLKDIQGVLNIKDKGETDEVYFLTTEYLQDGSIRNILARHPHGMSMEDAFDLFTPIADAIDRIHGKNIIHRDLKPENILYKKSGDTLEIFITDFGLVKFTGDAKLFQTETTAGTPWYIAPEAWIQDDKLVKTNTVDIYSLAVMLYEALEGKVPFDNPADSIKATPSAPKRIPKISTPETVEHLLTALSKNPDERPASAGAFIEAIRNSHYSLMDDSDQKWNGQRIRNYTIKEILGRGKMGVTMRATDEHGKDFVLKAFETGFMAGNPRQLFEKEIHSLQNLEPNHGVLLPLDHFFLRGTFYIVFEYQPGGNLRKFFNENRRQMDVHKILDVFTQIANAIDYTHSKKIIHRDLKPENVVYRMENGRIITYLTDFGIAEILEGTKSSFYTKTAAGTFYYMAPEAWDPKARKSKAMDIYSFGVMLYEALEGHVPFKAEYPAIMFQHISEKIPEPKTTSKKLGADAKDFVLEALAKKPEDRPKTAREIVDKLKGDQPDYYGRRYGKYVVESLIGQGAIGGATYKAIDSTNRKRKVALKILPISESINHEIEILKKLERHDGILPILDSGSHGGGHYLVTEFMSGGNRREYLQSFPGGLEFHEAVKIYKPIARALDYLHAKGVVHRDLKPENIVLRKTRVNGESVLEPFITDFGISKLLEKTPSLNTRTSVLAGTYKYIAPEVWDDQKPSPANDIYALGVMLYETLEGAPPFNARTPASIMKQHLNDQPPHPKQLADSRGDGAARALLRALAKNPQDRQPTAQELINDIEEAGRQATFSGSLTKPLGKVVNVFNKTRRAILGTIGVLVVLALFWFASQWIKLPPPTETITPSTTFSPTPPPTGAPPLTATMPSILVSLTPLTEMSSPTLTRIPAEATGTSKPPKVTTTIPATTIIPTTKVPTTVVPTTKVPTTVVPTTKVPTTVAPTTRASTNTPIPGQPACNDGIDNDQDGFTDWSNKGGDPQCQNKNDDDESG